MKTFAALLLAALLTACTPSSINPRDSKLADLAPGIDSLDKVVAELGPPKTEITHGSGAKTLIYDYAQVSTEPAPRRPAIAFLQRDRGVRTTAISVVFDRRGTLRYWAADATGRGQ